MEDNKYQAQLERVKKLGHNPIGINTFGPFAPQFVFATDEENEKSMHDHRHPFSSYSMSDEMIPIYDEDGDIIWLNK